MTEEMKNQNKARTEETSEKSPVTYLMVHNIPLTYRSCDLRNFFSQIVETGGFRCFHFRHRVEVQKSIEEHPAPENDQVSNSAVKCRRGKTCCAIVMVRTQRLDELVKTYNRTFWVTREGETLNTKCYLRAVTVAEDDMSPKRYLPPIEERQQRSRPVINRSDLRRMIELRPPAALPAGNVGTPTSYILRQINACNFPAQLIRRLGIEFPRTRAKGMYGSVPMNYGTSNHHEPDFTSSRSGKSANVSSSPSPFLSSNEKNTDAVSTNSGVHEGPETVAKSISWPKRLSPNLSSLPSAEDIPTFARTLKGHVISSATEGRAHRQQCDFSSNKTHERTSLKGEDSSRCEKSDERVSDSDDAEEWERHESLHNDVTSQERTKERLFEEEQEVVWEKGGSGLVFYTDAQFWDEAEGDFDAKTSDDWDIDTSVYYGDGAGDKDAKDFVSMEHLKRLRTGKDGEDDNQIGYFEKFTKGFGRRILEEQGWSEGRGVGKSVEGPSEPIESDGQHPKDRSGFGYRGEKLDRIVEKRAKRRRDRDVDDWGFIFSSVYDERFSKGEDPAEHDRNARSQEPTLLKYRKVFVKTSGATSSSANAKSVKDSVH